MRDWRELAPEQHTRAERVMHFIEKYLVVPEGAHVGKPLQLAPFQESFIYAVYDNAVPTRRAILSMARKNSKSATISALVLASLIGPERMQNSQLVAGAMTREQAGLIYSLSRKMLGPNPSLQVLLQFAESAKRIKATKNGSTFKALSADAASAHGLSPRIVILDETGQIVGPLSPFIDALTSAQGAYEEPLLIVISTQAANDADLLSTWIDEAAASQDPATVVHLYAADADADLTDETQWKYANPALDLFRSRADLVDQLQRAQRMPATEATARNLLLNQRITTRQLFVPPSLWKECAAPIDDDLFYRVPVTLGLDLSLRTDLCAAVLSAKDERGDVHIKPFVFCPEADIRQKELRDKAPYSAWASAGQMWLVPGRVVDYEWLALFLAQNLQGMTLQSLEFDRWGIESFKQACARAGWEPGCVWSPVGQGWKDSAPRLESFANALLAGRIRHGGHPLLNYAASNAISASDPAGNRKLDKAQSSARIDPLVAAVMSAYPQLDGARLDGFDVKALIG
jgi:phage terminase large subunit-like protein